MPDLGKALSQARVARGLTLQDAERDTRISRRYLEALEREDFKAFPAPVYTRAFLRTYAQYLGLNPAQAMALLPGAGREQPELRPLPEVPRPSSTSFSANWLVAGGAVIFLVVAFALFVRGAGGGSDSNKLPSPAAGQEALVQPRQLQPLIAGQVPDFTSVDLPTVLNALGQMNVNYVVIQAARQGVPPGLVYQQNPSPGAPISADQSVTLLVSR